MTNSVLQNFKGLFGPTKATPKGELYSAMPSWPMVIVAYVVALAVWVACERYLPLLKAPAYEVCKNLRGLPRAWADIALHWTDKSIKAVAVAMAVYHQLWQLGTRYRLTAQGVQVVHWFPKRQTTVVPYAFVRKASFSQDPLDLLLWSGTVEIDAGGASGPLVLDSCWQPANFFRLLQGKLGNAAPEEQPTVKNKNAARG